MSDENEIIGPDTFTGFNQEIRCICGKSAGATREKGAAPLVGTGEYGSPAAQSAEDFYRRLLEQICEDPRRTRARRLAESGLQFWDTMRAEAERAAMRQPQENAADEPRH